MYRNLPHNTDKPGYILQGTIQEMCWLKIQIFAVFSPPSALSFFFFFFILVNPLFVSPHLIQYFYYPSSSTTLTFNTNNLLNRKKVKCTLCCLFNIQKIVMSHVSIQLVCIFSITCFNFIYKHKITNSITPLLY